MLPSLSIGSWTWSLKPPLIPIISFPFPFVKPPQPLTLPPSLPLTPPSPEHYSPSLLGNIPSSVLDKGALWSQYQKVFYHLHITEDTHLCESSLLVDAFFSIHISPSPTWLKSKSEKPNNLNPVSARHQQMCRLYIKTGGSFRQTTPTFRMGRVWILSTLLLLFQSSVSEGEIILRSGPVLKGKS